MKRFDKICNTMMQFYDMLVLLAITMRVVGAVDYVDCGSAEIVASINTCRNKYTLPTTNDSAAICTYYSSVSPCVPGACCGDDVYAQSLLKMRNTLTALKIRCDTGCSDSIDGTDSCDSVATNKLVSDCQSKNVNTASSCAYYTHMASCVPTKCCNAVSYAIGLTFLQAKLDLMGIPDCKMVCAAPLSRGVRVLGNWPVVIFMAAMAVFIQ